MSRQKKENKNGQFSSLIQHEQAPLLDMIIGYLWDDPKSLEALSNTNTRIRRQCSEGLLSWRVIKRVSQLYHLTLQHVKASITTQIAPTQRRFLLALMTNNASVFNNMLNQQQELLKSKIIGSLPFGLLELACIVKIIDPSNELLPILCLHPELWQPTTHQAAEFGHIATLSECLKSGSEWINSVDRNRQTPLHRAYIKNRLGIAELLTLYGADKTLRDRANMKPVDYARQYQHQDMIELDEKSTLLPNPLA